MQTNIGLSFGYLSMVKRPELQSIQKIYNLCIRFNVTQHKQTVPHPMWQETTRIAVTNADTKLLCDDRGAIGSLLKNTVVS